MFLRHRGLGLFLEREFGMEVFQMNKNEERRERSQEADMGRFYSRGAVRTRGFISAGAPPETGGGPIRVRGAVHTSSGTGAPVMAKPWQVLECRGLSRLIEELRDAQDRFPITIVVENPQVHGGQTFLDCLCNEGLLGGDGALWVLGEGDYEEAVPEPLQNYVKKDAYLDIKREKQGERETFVNEVNGVRASILLPDLVFVADANAEKLEERLEKWEGSVWAVILDGPDDFDPSTLGLTLGIEEKPDWLRRWSD